MPLSREYQIIETLHENSSTLVHRAVRLSDKKKVIIKVLKSEAKDERTLASFVNEEKILGKIRSKKITKLISTLSTPTHYFHIFEDIGASSLLDTINTQEVSFLEKLQITYGVATAIKILHQKNIIHMDINPKNIIYNTQTKAVQLIDFGESNFYSHEDLGSSTSKASSANLFYISPEQTGLTKNRVDFRSDLYSLGMSLYHLFLGHSPYDTNDRDELIHKQIASTPSPLHEINKEIPLVLSEIISKLIEKKPNERYQSIQSLIYDLQECLKRTTSKQEIKHFKIARHNHPILAIGEQIFGRETEILSFKKLMKNLKDDSGAKIMVSGHSGVGKTRLIQEYLNYFDEKEITTIRAKFEQFSDPLPYASFKQLFSQLYTILMSQLDNKNLFKLNMKSSSILFFIFPELAPLFERKKIDKIYSHLDMNIQLPIAIMDLFKLIATEQTPLVIFIDDLQWVDEASSKLILETILKPSNPYLHFIASYRDNEINKDSLAKPLINYFHNRGNNNYLEVSLDPLSEKQFSKMLTTLLQQFEKEAEELSKILYKKTDGNPFYIKTLLQHLLQEKELRFEKGKWVFSLENIKTYSSTINIVELLSSQFTQLTPEQQSFLQYLSLLGNTFDLEVSLTMLLSFGYKEEILNEVEEKGFIEQNMNQYQFVHDQIQKNIYSSILLKQKQNFHHKIFTYLEKAFKAKEFHDITSLVYHLNSAYTLNSFPKKAFSLNVLALENLIENNAYNSALEKVEWIESYLYKPELWEKEYKSCFSYNFLKTKTYYLNANTSKAYDETVILLPHAKNISQKLLCFSLLKNISVTQGQNFEALISFGNELLTNLGLTIPEPDTVKDTLRSLQEGITSHPLHENPHEILKLKELSSTKKKHILSLLIDYWEVSYYLTDLDRMQWASLNIIDISFHFGNASESTFAYVLYGAQLASQKSYKKASIFGEVALKLNHRLDDKVMLPKVHNFVANFINSYAKPFNSNITLYQKSLHQSKLNGDIVFGTWANFLMHFSDYLSGNSITDLRESILKESSFILDSGDEKMISIFNVLRHHLDYLQDINQIDDTYEEKALALWKKEKFYPAKVWYALIKAQDFYIQGDFDKGLNILQQYVNNTENEVIMFPKIRLHLIRVLLSLAIEKTLNDEQTQTLNLDMQELKDFETANAKNFKFAKYLIKAEQSKDSVSMWDTAKLYDISISEAKRLENPFFISLATLSAGRFFQKLSFSDLSNFYFNEAMVSLNKWGAYTYSKTLKQSLEEKKQEDKGLLAHSSHHTKSNSSKPKLEQTNWNSLINAFNAISQAQNNEDLIKTLMQIILRNATASKAVLVLQEEGTFKVKSEIDFNSEKIFMHNTALQNATNIPFNVLSYAINTAEQIELINPFESGRFQFDAYIKSKKPASAFVIPSVIEGSLKALLYLENTELATPLHSDSIKTLELLLTQATIVFKNTSLFEKIQQSEKNLIKAQEISNIGSWKFNSEDGKIQWSAQTYRLYELEPFSQEIDYEWFSSHLHPDDIAYINKAVEKALSGERYYDVTHRIITSKGETRTVHQRAEAYFDGDIQKMSGTIQDITESELSKEKIMRLSQVVEQSPYTTIITDTEGKITYSNKYTSEMTGYTKKELLGKKMNLFRSHLHSNTFYNDIWQTIKDKKSIWKGTLINKMKNSENIDCQSTIFPILNDKNEIINFVTIQEDVTQRNIKDKLFLMQTRQAQIGEMLSMIAHQWRQPLSTINGLVNTQRVNILLGKYQEDTLINSFDDVEVQVNHLSRTITDFRDFFKPDKEAVETKSSKIITKVVSLIQHNLDKNSIDIALEYKDDPTFISFEHELEQVILNLFKNTQDAFYERKIKNPKIIIRCSKIKDDVVIQFEDNAKGINKQVIDTLFLPYISTKDQKHGTGLGLYMSKTIVEEHCKGSISVNNTLDGACFNIVLPIKESNE